MTSFTLDTNCLIDLEEGRAGAESVTELVEAHRTGIADVAVATVTASERQKDGGFLENYGAFLDRLSYLGLSDLTQIQPIAHWGVSFYGHGYLADQGMVDLEAAIHAVLSPKVPISYSKYCQTRELDAEARPMDWKWRNRLCDTQVVWSHIHHRREVLVTNDENFLKATKIGRLVELGANTICRPACAVQILRAAV